MPDRKWVEFTATGYVGLAVALAGILVPHLMDIQNSLIKLAGILLAIAGAAIAFNGRKEHGE